MSDQKPIGDNNQSLLQEEYLKSLDGLEEGQLIKGTVIEITPEQVFVDVGYKSEGRITLDEFSTVPEIGSTVQVVLVRKEGQDGEVVVSKKRADLKIFWKDIRVAFQEGLPVEGVFEKAIKGGFDVDLGFGVHAFNPFSKTDVIRVDNPEKYVGERTKFLIDRLYSENKIKIFLSRRKWLEENIRKARTSFFENTQIDDEVTGTVKSFTAFGAFIDLGGFDGLLHINDMSWGHVNRPKEFVRKGQKIKLKVVKLDPKNRKINLSLKHFTADPWSFFEEKYGIDSLIKGKVIKLTDFGAFIEIEEGIEGLAHISEFSWIKRIKHPKEVLSIGDEVETKVLAYDLQQGRLSLGLKQVLPNPWEQIQEHYPQGMRLTRRVKKITNAGVFIELEEGIDGFLHVDDISWSKRVKNPTSAFKAGDEVEVVVTSVDRLLRQIRLSIKQLSENPWRALASLAPRGTVIEGEVTNVTDFGVFLRVRDDIEGLVPKRQLSEPGNTDKSEDELLKDFKTGDKVKALITDINPKTQRLSLSIKEYQKSLERQELSKYIHDSEEESTFTLGDCMSDDKGQ